MISNRHIALDEQINQMPEQENDQWQQETEENKNLISLLEMQKKVFNFEETL